MDAEELVQGSDDREDERDDAPSETDPERAEKARHVAMETLAIMTENLRTFLLSRR